MTVADTLKITEETVENRDIIFNLVLSNFKVIPNWVKFYGLNIMETMQLDFSTYHVMIQEIQEYNQIESDAKQNLPMDLEEL